MSFVTGHVFPVTFNSDGQPFGDNAASLSTMIGWSVKNNIQPSFDKWSNVPRCNEGESGGHSNCE